MFDQDLHERIDNDDTKKVEDNEWHMTSKVDWCPVGQGGIYPQQ